MNEAKLYRVMVEVYTRAVDKRVALEQVDYTLHHAFALANNMEGFDIPDSFPIVEISDEEAENV